MRNRTRSFVLALVSLQAAFCQQAGTASPGAASTSGEKGLDYLLFLPEYGQYEESH